METWLIRLSVVSRYVLPVRLHSTVSECGCSSSMSSCVIFAGHTACFPTRIVAKVIQFVLFVWGQTVFHDGCAVVPRHIQSKMLELGAVEAFARGHSGVSSAPTISYILAESASSWGLVAHTTCRRGPATAPTRTCHALVVRVWVRELLVK